jgi:hypothetical protein
MLKLFSFFFYKIGKQEGRTGPSSEGEVFGTSERREVTGKGWEGEYGAKNMYTCM